MKKILLFTLLSLLFTSVKAQDWTFEEKKLNVCYTPDESRDSIYGMIAIKEMIGNQHLSLYYDTSVGAISICSNQKIEKRYKPNSLKIGKNKPILFEEKFKVKMGASSVDNYIPQKIFYLRNNDIQFIIIELFLYMPCSISGISGGYNSFVIRLDKKNRIKEFTITEFYREEFTKDTLINLLEKSI